MIKEGGVVAGLTWVISMLKSPKSIRMKHLKTALNGLLKRSSTGKETKENRELVKYLTEDAEFIGFVPNISYIMAKGDNQELNNLWVHPFSVPTLLYKVKDKPMLIVTNANLDYNDSVLSRIEHNTHSKELMKVLKNMKGITG